MDVEVTGQVDAATETDDAHRFSDDGERWVWLPKSKCSWEPRTSTMTLPEWLAVDRGLV